MAGPPLVIRLRSSRRRTVPNDFSVLRSRWTATRMRWTEFGMSRLTMGEPEP